MGAAACGGKGKGKWREANRRRQLQTATQPAGMPTPPRFAPSPPKPITHSGGTVDGGGAGATERQFRRTGVRALTHWGLPLGGRPNLNQRSAPTEWASAWGGG